MFTCRMCGENPLEAFGTLFGYGSSCDAKEGIDSKCNSPSTEKKAVEKKSIQKSKREFKEFERRSPQEIDDLVQEWHKYAHPRAKEFFSSDEQVKAVLAQLAKGIHKNDDAVLGDDTKCCFWYGDVTKDEKQAAILMIKPGEKNESITFVNRVLAFIFATEDSFEELQRLPKEPFKMSCGDQLCVNLAHISLQVYTVSKNVAA